MRERVSALGLGTAGMIAWGIPGRIEIEIRKLSGFNDFDIGLALQRGCCSLKQWLLKNT